MASLLKIALILGAVGLIMIAVTIARTPFSRYNDDRKEEVLGCYGLNGYDVLRVEKDAVLLSDGTPVNYHIIAGKMRPGIYPERPIVAYEVTNKWITKIGNGEASIMQVDRTGQVALDNASGSSRVHFDKKPC
jgi:hypothetical protein